MHTSKSAFMYAYARTYMRICVCTLAGRQAKHARGGVSVPTYKLARPQSNFLVQDMPEEV